MPRGGQPQGCAAKQATLLPLRSVPARDLLNLGTPLALGSDDPTADQAINILLNHPSLLPDQEQLLKNLQASST